jgi:hypothetical protein
MSATVKCDKCGKEAEGNVNNGFSKLSFRTKDEEGKSEMIWIDLCFEDSTEMTNIVLAWVNRKQ